jgi:hypothetical protein
MVRLGMVPHRGVPAVAVRISERHYGGCERGYDEDSKSLLENEFHCKSRWKLGSVKPEERCSASNHCDA